MQFEESTGFLPKFAIADGPFRYTSLAEALHECCDHSLDLQALNVFFRTGLFLGETTPFKYIRQYSPSPLIVQLRGWLTREQAIDGFVQLFHEAVAKRALHGTAMGLSGGRDSRHILLELAGLGLLPDYAVTVDFPNSNDAAVARELCQSLGVRHIVVPTVLTAEGTRWACRHANLMSMQHGWFSGVAAERDDRRWWDGIGGDVLSAGLFLERWNLALVRSNRLEELADRLVMQGPIPFFHDQSSFPREHAVERIHQELLRHTEAPNPIGSFYFWNRTRRDIASSAFSILRPSGQITIAPYLDRAVYDHLASLPAEYFIDHGFHDAAIAQAFPRFAGIEYSSKVADFRPGLMDSLKFSMEVARGDLRSIYITRLTLLLRALRCVMQPSCRAELGWLLPHAAYLSELSTMALPSKQGRWQK